jgi:endonuclease G
MTGLCIARSALVRLLLAAAIIVSANAIGAGSAHAKSRSCTSVERRAADKQLLLNKHDKDVAVETTLPRGVPQPAGAVTNEELLVQHDYVIDYDRTLLVPLWSAERLVASDLGREKDRINCFRADPRLKKPVASAPSDYKEPVYDQGHMTPNGDMTMSTNAVVNSFIMSNMTPQYCQLNRGVWQILEVLVRHWAAKSKTLYVITGSILDRDHDGRRDDDGQAKRMKSSNGKQRVAIPSHIYKIIAGKRSDGSFDVLTILLPNDQTDLDGAPAVRYLADHIRPLADVERMTGLRFFPDLDKPLHEASAPNIWDTSKAKFRSLVSAKCRETTGLD